MVNIKHFVWVAAGVVAVWIALGCSGLPYSNNSRPVEPPASAETPPQPANR
ncbi:MAG: hypothetical protein KJ914_07355 [Gammaproteobacteria bacterium]|nr:hypothetical protein [Gammaproteobacteria bacterium]MBU1722777.1 hypothetical protein [Gammaproteobacteria bacterium]MBU2005196.1 hypothetical protein [Gammaproteobacteria bacterium]